MYAWYANGEAPWKHREVKHKSKRMRRIESCTCMAISPVQLHRTCKRVRRERSSSSTTTTTERNKDCKRDEEKEQEPLLVYFSLSSWVLFLLRVVPPSAPPFYTTLVVRFSVYFSSSTSSSRLPPPALAFGRFPTCLFLVCRPTEPVSYSFSLLYPTFSPHFLLLPRPRFPSVYWPEV